MISNHSTLGEMLPRAYATRYTAAFGRQFFATLSAVVFKLAQSEMMQLESSVAEAIALQVLIDEARATMEEAAQQPSFGGLGDAAFQDLDHLYLWDPQGKSEPGIGEISGDLAFARWFTPYLNARHALAPYTWPDSGSSPTRSEMAP